MASKVCDPDSRSCHCRGALAHRSSGLRGQDCVGTRHHCQHPTWVEGGVHFISGELIEASSSEVCLCIPGGLVCTSLPRSDDSDTIARSCRTIYRRCGRMLMDSLSAARNPPILVSSRELSIIPMPSFV